jgi:hypothetical protein
MLLHLPLSAASPTTIPLPILGKIVTRSAHEIEASDWSVGGEVLDRDFASYAAYKKYLGPLGAKAIRLQAGWAKTDRNDGSYHWKWLDEVIDDTRSQGVQPWVQLSYGNSAYPGGGGKNMAEGGPTRPEGIAAWDRWATALVRRYRDRVSAWEIWNEPDLSHHMSLDEYIELFIRTAMIIRAEQPEAKIYALSLAKDTAYAGRFLDAIATAGKLNLIDAITFHGYPRNPDDLTTFEELRTIVARYPRAIQLRQGETGAPSGPTTGALSQFEWSENMQVKWNLRRMLAHYARGVPYNLFTLSEFYYPNGLNAKGLLKIRPDLSIVGPKPAYYAAQNVFAIFDSTLVAVANGERPSGMPPKVSTYEFRHVTSGRVLVGLWRSAEPATEEDVIQTIDLALPTAQFEDPVYVDLKSGQVFAIPAANWSHRDGGSEFRRLPVYDSPVVIASRADLRINLISSTHP